MKFLPLIFYLFIFHTYPSFTKDLTNYLGEDSSQWLKIYRYKTRDTVDNKSLVINQEWFFSDQGQTSPIKEIESAIEKLEASDKLRCQFPARSSLLIKHKLITAKKVTCPNYDYFKKKIHLKSVSLVFASYHVNNPSSAFGHTLLKLTGHGNENDLLEYGVNFAAVQTTANPLLYALYGLTGGFKGNFSLLPYFIKISEYTASESRNLWEYHLDFNQSEIDFLLMHLWEMDKAFFDYYYLTENCSFHLLLLLEAVRPSLQFTEKMPYFVLPSQTLKVLKEGRGIIKKKSFRPSQFVSVKERYRLLKDNRQYAFQKELPNSLSPQAKVDILDFQIDNFDLEKRSDLLKKKPQVVSMKRDLQGKRALLSDVRSQDINVRKPQAPDLIHPPRFLSLGMGIDHLTESTEKQVKNYSLLSYRFSFHEILDSPTGAPPWSQLVLGKVTASYDHDDKRFFLENFELFKTEANEQSLTGGPAISWGLKAGAADRFETQREDLGPYASTMVGINWQNNFALYRFSLDTAVSYNRPAEKKKDRFKADVSLMSTLYWYPLEALRFTMAVGPTWLTHFENQVYLKSSIGARLDLTKAFSIDLSAESIGENYRTTGNLMTFF